MYLKIQQILTNYRDSETKKKVIIIYMTWQISLQEKITVYLNNSISMVIQNLIITEINWML